MPISPEEQNLLDKVREVQQHGYGQVLVIIQDHQLIQVNWQKTELKVNANKKR